MWRAVKVLLGALVLLLAASTAFGQKTAWQPNKPLTLVVPFPAGGTSDVMGRMIAKELEKALGQPVNVENLPGGGGTVGTQKALTRPADGYTLIQSGIGQNAVAHALNPSLAYDSVKDLVHLTQVHEGANVLIVKPDGPYQSVKALVDAAKASPGSVTYGYTPAASGHMTMELMIQMLSVCITAEKGVPLCTGPKFHGTAYSGGKLLLDAVANGEVMATWVNVDAAEKYIKAGKIKPLAVSTSTRSPLLPDVPTMWDVGYPGFVAASWSGISVAKETPPAAVARLEAELTKIMANPAVRQRMEADGFTVPPQGSDHYSAFIVKEIARWKRLVRVAGIKA